MAFSVDFKNAVDAKDVRLVRIMLKDSMVVDPTFSEYNILSNYAENNLSELYDEHDGAKFSNDISEWNKQLLNKEMVNIVYNYSKERIDFLKKLCRYIYADKIDNMEREKFISEHKPINKKQIARGMMVGGGVTTVIGIVASQTALAVAGVVVAVVGGVIYYKNK